MKMPQLLAVRLATATCRAPPSTAQDTGCAAEPQPPELPSPTLKAEASEPELAPLAVKKREALPGLVHQKPEPSKEQAPPAGRALALARAAGATTRPELSRPSTFAA
jgi:hypothetical protein